MQVIFIRSLAVVCGACIGWVADPSPAQRSPPSEVRSRAIAAGEASRVGTTPVVVTPVATGGRRVTADTPLAPSEVEVLSQDPVTEAQREMDDTRTMRRTQCQQTIEHPTDALCEKILLANGRAIQSAIEIKQRFLRGQTDQEEFQTEYHKLFLERAIALEQLISPSDFLAHEGMQVGEDMFVAVLSGPEKAKDFHLGDDILDPELKRPTIESSGDDGTSLDTPGPADSPTEAGHDDLAQ